MRYVSNLLKVIGIPLMASCALLPGAPGALSQDNEAQQKVLSVKPSDADREAARQAKVVFRKAWSGHKVAASDSSKLIYRADNRRGNSVSRGSGDNSVRFAGDLTYQGGAFVEFTESHDIYMLPEGVCPVSVCWGDPERFLRDFGKSEFAHVTDQYVGQHASNRYTLGQNFNVPYTPPAKPFTDADMQAVGHSVAAVTGRTGYGHIYHVFLPAGQDECFDATFSVCASNFFCAYHSSVDFQDIGHVLYSIEPYTNVPGCQVRPGTPNGTLIDTTNDVLSHELTETITDPDGTGWWNTTSGSVFGQEIGDECVFILFEGNNVFSDPAIISVQGRKYALQPEYSNSAHGCVAER